jgi:hypothetical protein
MKEAPMSAQRTLDPDGDGNMQLEPPREPQPRAAETQAFPVEAFNPLLRSLLSWGLVERVEFDVGSHHWELTDAAQQRLDQLTPERRRASATLAYLDHWCSSCRQQHLTHLVDGSYLCVECQELQTSGQRPQPTGRHVATQARGGRRHRNR